MGKRIIILLLGILFSVLIAPVLSDPASDAGAAMVKKGVDLFAYSIGDSIYSIGAGNETVVDHKDAPNMIFRLLVFTIDPYTLPFVQDWQRVMLLFFVVITVLMIIGGASVVLISRHSPDYVQPIAHLFGRRVFDIRMWFQTIFTAIALLLFCTFGLYYIFVLEFVTSALITSEALTLAPPTIDNIVVYLLFAIIYLIFTFVMGIRAIVIVLMAAGALGLAALYLIPQTKTFAASVFMYFLVVLFLQPILLFIAAVGLSFVKILPPGLINYQVSIVLGLVVFMAIVSLVCILGKGIVKSIIWVGARAVI